MELKKLKPHIRLLVNNPTMKYETWEAITGMTKNSYRLAKLQANKFLKKQQILEEMKKEIDEFGLIVELRQKLKNEMAMRLKEKYGFINLKQTPLERI